MVAPPSVTAQGGNLHSSGVLASLLREIEEDGLHPPVNVRLLGEPELGEQRIYVLLNRSLREEQRLRDAGIVAPLRHLLEHLTFTRSEMFERGCLAPRALRDQRLDN